MTFIHAEAPDRQAPLSADTREPATEPDRKLAALTAIAAYYRISARPEALAHQLAIKNGATDEDLLRAAKSLGLKARATRTGRDRLMTLPAPSIALLASGGCAIFAGSTGGGRYRLVDPLTFRAREVDAADVMAETDGRFILVQRRIGGAGVDRRAFGLKWFLPSIWKYRRALSHVLLASLFVQLFALVTPLFFQVVVDKVLAHRSYSTLIVLVVGLAAVSLFDVILQYLRTYALSHTTNRIDVELGRKMFRHLLSLPLSYFETRPAGQTVARIRELETIRDFLTGQGLFSALDLVFTFVFIAVLFAYSTTLAWIVVASIPFYILIGVVIRPFLKERIDEKFERGGL